MSVHYYPDSYFALYDAVPEFIVHRNYPWKKTGDFSRFEKGALHGGAERQGGEAVYGVIGGDGKMIKS